MLKKNTIIIILSILYILHTMPFLGFRYPPALYAILIIALFFIFISTEGLKSVLKILPIFLIPLLDVFISTKTTLSFFQGISGFLQDLILPLLAIYIIRRNDVKTGKILLLIYIGINFITCITTYWGNLMFPGASRELATGGFSNTTMYLVYSNLNIGGFSFCYTIVLYAIFLIGTIKNREYIKVRHWFFVFVIIYLIAICMVVLVTEYTTALLMLVAVLLLFFIKRNFKLKYIIALGCFALISFYVFKPLIVDVLHVASENIQSDSVSHRLYDLSLSLDGKLTTEGSDLDTREEGYTKSLKTFIKTPFGTWNFNNIGGHSYFFDALSKYGIFGLILLIITIAKLYSIYMKPLNGHFIYGYTFVALLLFVAMGFVNPHLFTDVIMFVVPVYSFVLKSTTFNNTQNHKHQSRLINI